MHNKNEYLLQTWEKTKCTATMLVLMKRHSMKEPSREIELNWSSSKWTTRFINLARKQSDQY
jgi:hypothetical protein